MSTTFSKLTNQQTHELNKGGTVAREELLEAISLQLNLVTHTKGRR